MGSERGTTLGYLTYFFQTWEGRWSLALTSMEGEWPQVTGQEVADPGFNSSAPQASPQPPASRILPAVALCRALSQGHLQGAGNYF